MRTLSRPHTATPNQSRRRSSRHDGARVSARAQRISDAVLASHIHDISGRRRRGGASRPQRPL
jgi:hypothetical protein